MMLYHVYLLEISNFSSENLFYVEFLKVVPRSNSNTLKYLHFV